MVSNRGCLILKIMVNKEEEKLTKRIKGALASCLTLDILKCHLKI